LSQKRQVAGELDQLGNRDRDPRQRIAIGFRGPLAAQRQIDFTREGGERRPQFVRDRGGKFFELVGLP